MQNFSDKFQDTNVTVITQNSESNVIGVKGIDGDGEITMYEILDGVILLYNDFHMTFCSTPAAVLNTDLNIEFCLDGRIDMKGDDNFSYYTEKGDLRISSKLHGSGECNFPLSIYHSIGIGINKAKAQKALKYEFPTIDIDLDSMSDKFFKNQNSFTAHGDRTIENIFEQLNNVPKQYQKDFFKVKVLELLLRLKNMDMQNYKVERLYFNVAQVEKIKAIHRLIISDLTKVYTCEELSRKFDISLTTMKRCFKETYGSPIYKYLKSYRINNAANLLVTRRDLKVSDIAAMVGYETPSKFTAVFREILGETPIEYRKTH